MGVAALVLGLLGVMICWFPLIGWAGIAIALLAFVVGVVAIKKGIKGLGIAGLLLGLIGILWGLSVQVQYLSAADPDVADQGQAEPASEPKRTPDDAKRGRAPGEGDRL
jgi:hypothetical protein